MNLDLRTALQRAGGPRREATSNSPRVLLLFSSMLVMMFSWGAMNTTTPRLGALLVAAIATGTALFRPSDTIVRVARVEWALVIALLATGLIMTAGMLAEAVTDQASPVWFAVIAGYTILGLAGTLPTFRRLSRDTFVFWLFLLAHTAMAIIFLRSRTSYNDVSMFLHDGAEALLDGHNPYSMTFPNVFQSPFTELFYSPGVVVDGRITYGFPYLPVSLLVAIPGQFLGDVRYSQLIAILVTTVVLRRLARDRISRAAATFALASPVAIPMLTNGWTEPTLVALLACLVLALERRRHAFAAVLLGLFLVSKQYVVVAIPILWLIRHYLTRRVIIIGLGVAGAVTLPFFLVDPAAFWKAIVEFQLVQPFRSDSTSLLVSSVKAFGWPPPWTYGVLPLMGGGLTAVALALRAPRTPAAFAAGVGLTLLVTILLSKQAFVNYYFLVSSAFLIAAVAWPTSPAPARSTPMPSPDEAPVPLSVRLG